MADCVFDLWLDVLAGSGRVHILLYRRILRLDKIAQYIMAGAAILWMPCWRSWFWR